MTCRRSFLQIKDADFHFLLKATLRRHGRGCKKSSRKNFRKSKWFTYDAIDSGIHQRVATQIFGQSVKPIFHFDKAKVILSLDCDFIGGEDDAHNTFTNLSKAAKLKTAA